jgi:hypothetical protein
MVGEAMYLLEMNWFGWVGLDRQAKSFIVFTEQTVKAIDGTVLSFWDSSIFSVLGTEHPKPLDIPGLRGQFPPGTTVQTGSGLIGTGGGPLAPGKPILHIPADRIASGRCRFESAPGRYCKPDGVS